MRIAKALALPPELVTAKPKAPERPDMGSGDGGGEDSGGEQCVEGPCCCWEWQRGVEDTIKRRWIASALRLSSVLRFHRTPGAPF